MKDKQLEKEIINSSTSLKLEILEYLLKDESLKELVFRIGNTWNEVVHDIYGYSRYDLSMSNWTIDNEDILFYEKDLFYNGELLSEECFRVPLKALSSFEDAVNDLKTDKLEADRARRMKRIKELKEELDWLIADYDIDQPEIVTSLTSPMSKFEMLNKQDYSKSIAERHQFHARTCSCLNDSSICCDLACFCDLEILE